LKVYLVTFGCQMNEYDSELVRSILSSAGYSFTDEETDADVILLNTCSVRDNAHRKVYGNIHEIRHRRQKNPPLIGILGCMATSLRQELLEKKDLKLDFVAGPDSYKRLPEILENLIKSQGHPPAKLARPRQNEILTGKVTKSQKTSDQWPVASDQQANASDQSPVTGHQQNICDVTLSEFETYSDIYPMRTGGVNAWIAAMRGCNNFCTFCVVPYTRGRERSRTIPSIMDEAMRVVNEEGAKQITLLGQNVNSFASDGQDFADLLNFLSTIVGLERIRFMSPHPKDFPDKLLDVIATNPKICKHIHLPLQAGSSRVLEMMNRGYTREDFVALVKKIRAKCPSITLTTDVIVGFPTETDKEFQETFDVMREVEFDSAFIFKYSPRPNTVASKKFKDDVPEIKKTLRIVSLNNLQKGISLKKNQALIGQTLEVMIEQHGTDRSSADFQGRTEGNKLLILPDGPYKIGDIIKVRITAATPHVLKAVADNS